MHVSTPPLHQTTSHFQIKAAKYNALIRRDSGNLIEIDLPPSETRLLRRGSEIPASELSATGAKVFLSGWAAHTQTTIEGDRQIICLLLPGDSIALHPSMSILSYTRIVALTDTVVADANALRDQNRTTTSPERLLAIGRSALLEEATIINQIIRLGHPRAINKMIHLLLEIRERLELVGQASRHEMAIPISHEKFADTLALSAVHISRCLSELRARRLLDWRKGTVTFHDLEALYEVADYNGLLPREASEKWMQEDAHSLKVA